jgi:hypothetical protein
MQCVYCLLYAFDLPVEFFGDRFLSDLKLLQLSNIVGLRSVLPGCLIPFGCGFAVPGLPAALRYLVVVCFRPPVNRTISSLAGITAAVALNACSVLNEMVEVLSPGYEMVCLIAAASMHRRFSFRR